MNIDVTCSTCIITDTTGELITDATTIAVTTAMENEHKTLSIGPQHSQNIGQKYTDTSNPNTLCYKISQHKLMMAVAIEYNS